MSGNLTGVTTTTADWQLTWWDALRYTVAYLFTWNGFINTLWLSYTLFSATLRTAYSLFCRWHEWFFLSYLDLLWENFCLKLVALISYWSPF